MKKKLNFVFVVIILLSMMIMVAADESDTFKEADEYATKYVFTENAEDLEDVDWLLSMFFYLNILWYLLYCNFITEVTF